MRYGSQNFLYNLKGHTIVCISSDDNTGYRLAADDTFYDDTGRWFFLIKRRFSRDKIKL